MIWIWYTCEGGTVKKGSRYRFRTVSVESRTALCQTSVIIQCGNFAGLARVFVAATGISPLLRNDTCTWTLLYLCSYFAAVADDIEV